jgi:ketosteroid isomerase-like protein
MPACAPTNQVRFHLSMPAAPHDLIRRAYDAFNARDIDAVLAVLHPDVDWPNAWEGGRVRGHDEVRDYWTRQWAEIHPTVEPTHIAPPDDDGRVAVTVHAVVRSPAGELLNDGTVVHVYEIRDGLIGRMDVEEA